MENKIATGLVHENLPQFKYFYEISQIPRPSFHEEKIVNYIEDFAKERSLWYDRDSLGNIIIKKAATKGRESEPPIVLQAHTDMVCEKTADSDHDFMNDPIEIFIEDGWMKANGTTLGADDGAGVANILAILDEDESNISHPPLECVFTVQEEDGMGGAKALDFSLLTSKRMIGLDGVDEGSTIFSGAAVYTGELVKKLEYEESDVDSIPIKLSVTGLSSGHGALNIGKEQANSIKLIARMLERLNHEFGIQLIDINGGTVAIVIPYECDATFLLKSGTDIEKVKTCIEEMLSDFREEYAQTDADLTITYTIAEKKKTCISKEQSDRIIDLLNILPVGAYRRDPNHLDRVTGSWNVAIIKTTDEEIRITDMCRANWPVDIATLKSIVDTYAALFEMDYEEVTSYLGFSVPLDSPLTNIWEAVYQEKTGNPFVKSFCHGGLDAGMMFNGLGGKKDEVDLIVVMPQVIGFHTPQEKMDVNSFILTYDCLKEILARI